MRKALLFVIALLAAGCLQAAAQDKKEERELSREEQELLQEKIDSVQHAAALEAMRDSSFTLEADHVVFKYGQRAYVSSSTNFVSIRGDKATVQVSFNIPVAGSNGMGGITLDGNVTDYKMKTDKKGNTFLTATVMGTAISAQLSIMLPARTNNATVDVLPTFSSNRISLVGTILPADQSFTVKGRSI